jgi:hypothetical protein
MEHSQQLVLTGGAVTPSAPDPVSINPDALVQKATYFKKINSLFAIFFICTLVALIIMKIPDIARIIFKEDDPDSNFEEEDGDLKKRWRRIMIYTFSFIVMILLVHVLVFIVLLFVLMAKEGDVKKGVEAFTNFVWEYKDGGKTVGLLAYYVLMFIVLIGVYLFYLIYTILVKSYFRNIYYEPVDRKDPESEDLLQPQKYLYRYAVFVVLMMLFVLLLLNYSKLSDFKIIFIYNIVIILLYIILTTNIIRFNMQGNIIKFLVYILIFIIMVIIYQYPLQVIAKSLSN